MVTIRAGPPCRRTWTSGYGACTNRPRLRTARFLVDRLWPRGVAKEKAALAGWLRDVALSTSLRKWFRHGAARWPEFQRYAVELRRKPEAWRPILDAATRGRVTLVFAAQDPVHSNAAALKAFVERQVE